MVRVILFFLIIISLSGYSQDVKVRGQFLVDSIKIGQPFPFALSAEYPWENNILFPDSTYNFAPFEYVAKQYFPTLTIDGISHDSTIYYLNSFEIDSLQWLKLPVYVIQQKDCTEVWTQERMVWLQHLVTINTDSLQAANLPLKVDAYYVPVDWLFNYPVASIGGGSVLVILLVCWILFGKRIRRYFKVRSMKRTFERYLQTFNTSVESLKESGTIPQAEKTLVIWKKYLETLEDKPFTKYTSKEILQVINDANLSSPLKTVDRFLYAGVQPSTFDAFYELKSYSEDCFYKKLQEINSPEK